VSEIEPFPNAVVAHHFQFSNLGDMTKITEEQIEQHGPIDIFVGGTPCQSFSVRVYGAGCADIADQGHQYLIRVKPSASYQEAVDALQHEFAHALAGFMGGARHEHRDHGSHWGEALATVHQACLKLWNDQD